MRSNGPTSVTLKSYDAATWTVVPIAGTP